MATWWELAIPAAGVVAGATVTGIIQSVNARGQRENERKVRFLEERRASYARFLLLFDDLTDLVKRLDKLKVSRAAHSENLKVLSEQLSALQSEGGNSSTTRDPAAMNAEKNRIVANIDAVQLAWDQDSAELDECLAKVKSLEPQVGEIYYLLRLVAAKPVRQAASKMIEIGIWATVNDPDAIKQAMKDFEQAARKDLL